MEYGQKNLYRLKQIINILPRESNQIHVIHSIKSYRSQIYSGFKYGKIRKKSFIINNIFYYSFYWIYANLKAILYLLGTEMDYVEEKFSAGFKFNNPNETSACGCGESVDITPISELEIK